MEAVFNIRGMVVYIRASATDDQRAEQREALEVERKTGEDLHNWRQEGF